MGDYRLMPKSRSGSSGSSSKKPSKLVLMAAAGIAGLLLGFFSPIELFSF